jgi:hypothetical protein
MGIVIANPIYDTIFKFLLEDLSIAKELIATIIDEDILTIEVKPQENTTSLNERSLTVYRLDFLAEIKTSSGQKKVLIELQKAKLVTDIMRFRRYLGEQYKKDELPIITIYFLGYTFEESLPAMIQVSRSITDRLTNETSSKISHPFIDSLTHDSFIIQIPKLKLKLQNKLERVLSIFGESYHKERTHIVEYDIPIEDDLQKRITGRLNYAVTDDKLKRQIDLEEEVLLELQNLERKVDDKDKELIEKDRVIGEKDKVIGEKEKELNEKDKLIEELKKQLEGLK